MLPYWLITIHTLGDGKKTAIIILLFSQFQERMNKTTFHKISLSQYCHITKNRAKKEAGVPRIKNPTELLHMIKS